MNHYEDGGKTFRERLKFRVGREGDVSIVEEEDEVSILQSEVEDFKNLLTTNSMYTLRINSVDGRRSSPAIYATIPACELQKSNFKEEFGLSMDRDGNLVGLHVTSPVIALPRTCDPRKIASDKGLSFLTKVRVLEPTTAAIIPVQATGPRPLTLANVKVDAEDVAEGTKPEAQQSILRKYWYIVLPMVIFTLFGGAEPPPEGATGSDKGDKAQPATK